jgi:GTP-binding protein Era
MTEFRSGFVALLGRPNVGKSSIVNAVTGRKVSIVSDKPQTTRHRVMGVYTRDDAQIVFVDTPGLHKAVSALGERVNATALGSTDGVDVPCLVLDATQPFGNGDRWVADHLDLPRAVVIVNKVDVASKNQVFAMLTAAGDLDAEAYFPVSARTGAGIEALVAHLVERLPEGPMYFPADEFTDMP